MDLVAVIMLEKGLYVLLILDFVAVRSSRLGVLPPI